MSPDSASTLAPAPTTVHQHQFDVVIVGAGGAGMRAAIEAGTFAAFEADFHAGQARGDIEPIGTG